MSYLTASQRQSELSSASPHPDRQSPFAYPAAPGSHISDGDMMSGPSRGNHFQHPGSPYGVRPAPTGHGHHMSGDPSLGMNPADPGSRYGYPAYDARQALPEGTPASPDRQPSYVATQFHPSHANALANAHGYGHHPHGSPVQHSPNPDFRGHNRQPTWGSPAPATPSYHLGSHRGPHSHMSPGGAIPSPQQMDHMRHDWRATGGGSVLGKRVADHQLISDRQGAAPSPVMYGGGVPSGLTHPTSASSADENLLRQQQQHGGWNNMPARPHDVQDRNRLPGSPAPGDQAVAHPRASSSPSASSSHAPAASASATPAHSTSVRHPPPNTQGGNQPSLVRTSQIPPQPSNPGPSAGFQNYTNKAMLKIHSDLGAMTTGWSPEEWTARRRLVQFTRWQDAHTINVQFRAITLQEFQPTSIVISCIYREERNECYVTSVDTIYLLEALIGTRFTVEEKNRIRRNLEGFKPQTVSKSKPDSEAFFKLIMMYPNPRPRNIEKDVKVFPWRILPSALRKIVGKYSATYNVGGDNGDQSASTSADPRGDDGASVSTSSVQGLLDSHVPNDAGPTAGPSTYEYGQAGGPRPPSLDFSQILAHPYDPQFAGGHAVGGSEDGGSYDTPQHSAVGVGEGREGELPQGSHYGQAGQVFHDFEGGSRAPSLTGYVPQSSGSHNRSLSDTTGFAVPGRSPAASTVAGGSRTSSSQADGTEGDVASRRSVLGGSAANGSVSQVSYTFGQRGQDFMQGGVGHSWEGHEPRPRSATTGALSEWKGGFYEGGQGDSSNRPDDTVDALPVAEPTPAANEAV